MFLRSLAPYNPYSQFKPVQAEEPVKTVVFKAKKEKEVKNEVPKKEKVEIPPVPVSVPKLERQQAVIEEEPVKKGPKNPRFKAGSAEALEWSKAMIIKRKEAKERKEKEKAVEPEKKKVDENQNIIFIEKK
jgi:hypothetical protein